MPTKVAALLVTVAIGVAAPAFALIFRSDALAALGTLALAAGLHPLWVIALFAQRPPPASNGTTTAFCDGYGVKPTLTAHTSSPVVRAETIGVRRASS